MVPTTGGCASSWAHGDDQLSTAAVASQCPHLHRTSVRALSHRPALRTDLRTTQPRRLIAVGGGSDGNFTAGAGVPTLDGLGAVGDGAHAEGEHVLVSHMEPRARLLAALLQELL